MKSSEVQRLDETEASLWWFEALHQRLLDQLQAVPDGARVLDAGCGTGGFLLRLARHRPGLVRVGVELDRDAALRARRKAEAPVVNGSVLALPFADRSFDAVISSDVLCHEGVDQDRALEELRRCLAPGGLLLLNLPAYPWLASAHDRAVQNARRYIRPGVETLLQQAGFAGIRTWHWNSLLFPVMVLHRKLLAAKAATSDVAPMPPYLDATFRLVSGIERRLSRDVGHLPWGGSVMASARVPL